ncbi:Ubiquitin carboxyl-terminal hydrolase 6 [Vulpes lagopus]
MQEDPETLLALQRANIVAQYHQVRPRRDHRHYTPTTGGTVPARAERTKQGLRRTCHCARSPTTRAFCNPRDRELPDPSPREAKKLRQETRRADKWIKMLKRWDHYLPSEKLRRRVYKGVPPQVRGQVWLRLLNVDQVKARNAGKYQAMKEAALVSSRDIVQIDLDVNRTFRSHTMFWDRYGVGDNLHLVSTHGMTPPPPQTPPRSRQALRGVHGAPGAGAGVTANPRLGSPLSVDVSVCTLEKGVPCVRSPPPHPLTHRPHAIPLHHPPHHPPQPQTPTPTLSVPPPPPPHPHEDAVQLPPVGHAQPPRPPWGSLDGLLPSEARVSRRVPRGRREVGKAGSPRQGLAGNLPPPGAPAALRARPGQADL